MKNTRVLLSLVIAILAVSLAAPSYAQGRFGADSASCVNSLNFYRDYLRQGNIKDAAPIWRKAMRACPPTVSQNMYIEGRKIVKYLLGNATDATLKKNLADTLFMLYDTQIQYFPKYRAKGLENKVYDMITYLGEEDNQKIFETLEEVIKTNGTNSDPGLLVAFMSQAKNLYMEKKLSDAEVLNIYSEMSGKMDEIVKTHPTDDNKSAQKAFENAFITSGVANCDNLVTVFAPRFEANPTDKDLLNTIVKLLSDNECVQTDLFLKSVVALHQIDPSYNSAYFLYKLYNSKDENDKALEFLQEAIDNPEVDDARKGELLFEKATYLYTKANSPAKAVAMAKEAIEKNPTMAGKANFLIGSIWAQAKCTGNELDVRAKYWVAVDYMIKARNADPELTEEASKQIATYSKYFPLVEDAFMYDVTDGKPYTVSCGGLNATTTVRTQKQ